MKKQGFTLAEILITLGVIGIVAAITLPGLNSNVNSRKVGPALAKAVNTLENANRTALMEEGQSTLNELSNTYTAEGDKSCYINKIAKYLIGEYDNEAKNSNPKINDNLKNGAPTFRSKDGITYMVSTIGTGDGYAGISEITGDNEEYNYSSSKYSDDGGEGKFPNKKYFGKFYPVLIDINGAKKPNLYAKDQFIVIVDYYGAVIPLGGQESVDYGTDVQREVCTAAKAGNNPRCAGSIADAGWEVRY